MMILMMLFGELSGSLDSTFGVGRWCPIFSFLFHFVMGIMMMNGLMDALIMGVDIANEKKLLELVYFGDRMFFFESAFIGKLH